jgi:hypothetical protein
VKVKTEELEVEREMAKELRAMHTEQKKYAKQLEYGLAGAVVTNAVLLVSVAALLAWMLKDTMIDSDGTLRTTDGTEVRVRS